jgi:hypothetical protein
MLLVKQLTAKANGVLLLKKHRSLVTIYRNMVYVLQDQLHVLILALLLAVSRFCFGFVLLMLLVKQLTAKANGVLLLKKHRSLVTMSISLNRLQRNMVYVLQDQLHVLILALLLAVSRFCFGFVLLSWQTSTCYW